MKKIFLFLAFLFFLANLQAQNFLYIGDDSYPASEIKYFKCGSCDFNSYQMKSGKGSSLTLEFQTAKTDSQFFVRISVQPRRSFPNKLDKKISIFFTNGQRIVLSTPVREEQIDQMQELFFSLTESQVTLLENSQISKIQYGIIENIDYNKKINKVFLADAVPYTE